MGHTRLGRLPHTMRWRQVLRLLDEPTLNEAAVARATTLAAERRLRTLANDPILVHAFWLLTRMTAASHQPDFESELAGIGIQTSSNEPILRFISRVSDAMRSEAAAHPESGHFSELASLALRRALTETVGQHGASLFGSSVDDLRAALRQYSGSQSFGRVARLFFGDLFARTLRSYVERELSNRTGAAPALRSIDDSQEFTTSLDRYARESARIMESFAAGWYSKHNWESQYRISRGEAEGFVGVALRKLRSELASSES